MDFVIQKKDKVISYIATNKDAQVWGFKSHSSIEECLQMLKEDFNGVTYTHEGIEPDGRRKRAFTNTDKIFLNKLNQRLSPDNTKGFKNLLDKSR